MIEQSDEYLIRQALLFWRNYIQTGDMVMSTNDLIACGQTAKIRQLNSDQQEFIIRLEELAEKYDAN